MKVCFTSSYLRGPQQLVTPPKSDVLVVSRGSEDLVVGMNRQTPQLSAVAEHNLVEPSLQGTLENVVARGPHVNVTVVPSRTLRIYTADTAHRFRQL